MNIQIPEKNDSSVRPLSESSSIRPRISIVTPIFNEVENIDLLIASLNTALEGRGSFEVICVDDGSTDGSFKKLKACIAQHSWLRVIRFRRNYGQTAALQAGINHSVGEIIVTIDADLQNDPRDIPMLVDLIENGADVVCGWRKNRKDAKLRRNFLSRVANRVISKISGVSLHDYGCTLKAFRAEMIHGVRLYGEMHRFIPIYAKWMGANIEEVEVRHYPRKFGTSKYGLERILKVLLDLLLITFLDRYLAKPIYVFGAFSAFCLVISVLVLCYSFFLKFAEGTSLIQTPLPVLSATALLMGAVSMLLGLLAEIVTRTYFESQGRFGYEIRDETNFANIQKTR
ncbi:glycosyltransferase involved in cell wall biosynthesis [Bradyrhizobium sp. USDA 4474]